MNYKKYSKYIFMIMIFLFSFQPIIYCSNVVLAEDENQASETPAVIENTAENPERNTTASSSDDAAIVDTGNAEAGSLVENEINSNAASTDCSECNDGCASSTTGIDIDNHNIATTTNAAQVEANTGQNTAMSSSSDARITTGDIDIVNIIINLINTNFFGNGKYYFVNIFNSILRAIDLSGFGSEPEVNNDNCQVNCDINTDNSNSINLENTLVINADTGKNLATGNNSTINTGNIEIVNDVVNIANLNITGEEWFFAVVNIYGELKGDIILPAVNSEEAIAEAVKEVSAQELDEKIIVTNTNAVNLINNIAVNASTGENEISSSTSANISTGNVYSKSTVLNLVNYNIFGNSWRFARINLYGSWDGLIYGLPDGYNYVVDENGVVVYNNFFLDSQTSREYAQLIVDNYNEATTTNDIEINANTGENSITDSESGTIKTGSISIKNFLLNFINSNFTGNNWKYSMINVFGNWQGNLSFGKPDLWVTESIEKIDNIKQGSLVTFKFLFGNKGDATAKNVILKDSYNKNLLNATGDSPLWNIGDLPPNSQGSISYTLQVRNDVPTGMSKAMNLASISNPAGDRNDVDNEATGSFDIDGGGSYSVPSAYSFSSGAVSYRPDFSIVKTNNANNILKPGDKVDFKINIKNTGNESAKNVIVLDVMKNMETGEEINHDSWNLQEVKAGEEIIINYTIEIKGNIKTGIYLNEAIIEGYDNINKINISQVASSKINVENLNYKPAKIGDSQLIISKTSRKTKAYPGDVITNEIIITNNGLSAAEDVKIIESLSTGLEFIQGEKSVREWNLGTIGPGQIKSTMYNYRIKNDTKPGLYISASVLKSKNQKPIVSNLDINVLEKEKNASNLIQREIKIGFLTVPTIDNEDYSDDEIKVLGTENMDLFAEEAKAYSGEDDNKTAVSSRIFRWIFEILFIIFLVGILFIIKNRKYFREEKNVFKNKNI